MLSAEQRTYSPFYALDVLRACLRRAARTQDDTSAPFSIMAAQAMEQEVTNMANVIGASLRIKHG